MRDEVACEVYKLRRSILNLIDASTHRNGYDVMQALANAACTKTRRSYMLDIEFG
jgi:hypothetical protein